MGKIKAPHPTEQTFELTSPGGGDTAWEVVYQAHEKRQLRILSFRMQEPRDTYVCICAQLSDVGALAAVWQAHGIRYVPAPAGLYLGDCYYAIATPGAPPTALNVDQAARRLSLEPDILRY